MLNKLNKSEKFIYYTILLIITFLLFAPFLYMVSISLTSPESNAMGNYSVIPKEFYIQNYLKIFADSRLLNWIKNSAIITGISIVGQVMASSLIAYGFARFRARGKNWLFMVVLLTMMIPAQITMIPTFVIFAKLGWYNTILPLIIPNFFGHAFNIFLLRQFIVRIPKCVEQAAQIDGLGYFGVYWHVILPQIKPVLVTISIFTFNSMWGDFFGPLLYIKDVDKTTLAYGVKLLSAPLNSAAGPDWSIVMVASMLLTIPMIAVFFFGQKKIFEDGAVSIGGGGK